MSCEKGGEDREDRGEPVVSRSSPSSPSSPSPASHIPSRIAIVVEVVSTNWRDDYSKKLDDYELLGIPEYWIADYRGLGAKRLIGSPKSPTISVCCLTDDGEYQVSQFKGSEQIQSVTFPELALTVDQLVEIGASAT